MIFVGIRGSVLALDEATGAELWRSPLKGGQFVNVTLVAGVVYATTKGEIYALDSATGQIRWHNPMRGLGTGLMTIAGADQAAPSAEKARRDQAAAAGAAAAAG
jgi:outer membrane protein assembly factor BamB